VENNVYVCGMEKFHIDVLAIDKHSSSVLASTILAQTKEEFNEAFEVWESSITFSRFYIEINYWGENGDAVKDIVSDYEDHIGYV